MDPFEARLTFLDLLGRVTASQQTIQRAAQFALNEEELCEDLCSCVLEELDQASINARVNLLYTIDALVQPAIRGGFTGYRDQLRPDLTRIIQAVVPEGQLGAVNLSQTRKVLETWRKKQVFSDKELEEAEQVLGDRLELHGSNVSGNEEKSIQQDTPLSVAVSTGEPAASQRLTLSKDEILRRMEEDRERHKRIREEAWLRHTVDEVVSKEDPAILASELDAEFAQLWQSSSNDSNIGTGGPGDDRLPLLSEEDILEDNRHYLPDYDWQYTQQETWRNWWSDEEDSFLEGGNDYGNVHYH
ncbi:CTD kinase subunit gamma CTK3-domain-containing protein [Syncephalis plumigaleata]|nr:CTD kinase subunit gamma CTK3-domain-containing protein [Syncephalis plumigaleata]